MQYQLLWSFLLTLALFYPVRQLIWTLSVRHQERNMGTLPDKIRWFALKRRKSVTAALLCFAVAVLYQNVMMNQV